MFTELKTKLKNKDAEIGIIGLGYVGLPLVLRYIECGFKVTGYDIDPTKVNSLLAGKSYIDHISSKSIENCIKGKFKPTTDFSLIPESDALIICVPTPLSKYREPDLSYITGTMDTIKPYLRKGQVLSLESTTYPGTTEEVLKPYLDKAGFKIGEDFFLIYSPEREDPGNPNFNTQSIPKVCGGHTQNCLEIGIDLYSPAIDKVVPVSSTQTAEMTKLLENIHRAVNIGLVNEMKIVADKMGIDIHEVIRAAATKPFGFTPYYPGPGLGGHCIPIDPFYLTWKAREFGLHTRFIELAGEVNTSMPHYVVSKVADSLNKKGIALNGSKILVLGIAYKKNVDDMRESPSVELMTLLREKGAEIAYSDPYIPEFPKLRKAYFELSSRPITADELQKYDCVLVATDHDTFDYETILKYSRNIVDTRGKFLNSNEKVIKA